MLLGSQIRHTVYIGIYRKPESGEKSGKNTVRFQELKKLASEQGSTGQHVKIVEYLPTTTFFSSSSPNPCLSLFFPHQIRCNAKLCFSRACINRKVRSLTVTPPIVSDRPPAKRIEGDATNGSNYQYAFNHMFKLFWLHKKTAESKNVQEKRCAAVNTKFAS
jgi:hypothetical protein